MLTGVKEGLHLRRQSYFVQFELMTKCVLARWADENLQVWEASISKATKRVLDELADEQFYGGELQQLAGGERTRTRRSGSSWSSGEGWCLLKLPKSLRMRQLERGERRPGLTCVEEASSPAAE